MGLISLALAHTHRHGGSLGDEIVFRLGRILEGGRRHRSIHFGWLVRVEINFNMSFWKGDVPG